MAMNNGNSTVDGVSLAASGVADALRARRLKSPSSSFKVELQTPSPSDPTRDLPTLVKTTEAYNERNDRMAIGLVCGFRRLEMHQIPEAEMKSVITAIRAQKAEREAARWRKP